MADVLGIAFAIATFGAVARYKRAASRTTVGFLAILTGALIWANLRKQLVSVHISGANRTDTNFFPPTHHGNIEDTIMTLTGAGFNSGTTVSLIAANGTTTYPLSNLTIDSPTQMTATIPANAVPGATYTVKVAQADGSTATLPGAFKMVQGGVADLVTNLIVPNPIGYHEPSTLYIQYSNTGDIAMAAPILMVTAYQNGTEGALMSLDPANAGDSFGTNISPAGFGQSVMLLANGVTPVSVRHNHPCVAW